jgi:hypothetical protein
LKIVEGMDDPWDRTSALIEVAEYLTDERRHSLLAELSEDGQEHQLFHSRFLHSLSKFVTLSAQQQQKLVSRIFRFASSAVLALEVDEIRSLVACLTGPQRGETLSHLLENMRDDRREWFRVHMLIELASYFQTHHLELAYSLAREIGSADDQLGAVLALVTYADSPLLENLLDDVLLVAGKSSRSSCLKAIQVYARRSKILDGHDVDRMICSLRDSAAMYS